MKIVSWNILHGGGSRIDDIAEALTSFEADLVCLQEFRTGEGSKVLERRLTEQGLVYSFIPKTRSRSDNTVALFSRSRIDNPGGFLSAEDTRAISCKIEGISIVAAHVPQKKAQVPYFEALWKLPVEGKGLVIGDLNCGIPFEDSDTKTFYATDLFQKMLRKGWVDSWRSRNQKQREYTWISARKGNGFRYDHALATPDLNQDIVDVAYQHEVREQGISDHSALLVKVCQSS